MSRGHQLEIFRFVRSACQHQKVSLCRFASASHPAVALLTVNCVGLWGALNHVSFDIKSGECCGILSAKGLRGRSSVVAALFRLGELTSGRITIDGLDISQLGLLRLRRAVSFVPLQPVLFAGSIRKNLDPLSLYSDDEVSGCQFSSVDILVSNFFG